MTVIRCRPSAVSVIPFPLTLPIVSQAERQTGRLKHEAPQSLRVEFKPNPIFNGRRTGTVPPFHLVLLSSHPSRFPLASVLSL